QKYIYRNNDELLNLIQKLKINLVISLASRSFYGLDVKTMPSVRWVTLQHWGDNFQTDREKILDCDILQIYSREWWKNFVDSDHGKKIFPASLEAHSQIVITGCPYHDIGKYLDREKIRLKYGIAPEKRVVLYAPVGMNIPDSRARRFWLKAFFYSKRFIRLQNYFAKLSFIPQDWRVSERNIVDSIREFCDRENAVLIVKGRVKKPISEYINKVADYVFYDEDFYPSTIIELIKISDLAITHFSSMSFELAHQGVYNINVKIGPTWAFMKKSLCKIFGFGFIFDLEIDGLNEICDSVSFLNKIKTKQLDDFRVMASKVSEFSHKYFNGPPGDSTRKTVDAILLEM
ncbi:MAG: CDP-glycerol glycerophosphotransferase family protein, partial [Bdellovibrionota bacterium]